MKKTLLSIFLAVCMLLTNISVIAEENASADYKEAVELLSMLNIITVTDYNDDFSDQTFVTREEFCVYLARAFKLEARANARQIFSDVPQESSLADYVNALYEKGVVSGYGGAFRPRDFITYNEAIKMLVAVLNYDYASEVGGYPEGYLRIASSLDITKKVYTAGDLTKGAAAQLIYNAMTAPFMEVESIKGTNITFKSNSDKSVLTELYDIYEGEGVVLANGRSAFVSGKVPSEMEEVLIGDTIYKTGKSNVADLLGHYIEFYYIELDNDEFEIVTVLEDRAEELVIDSNRIISFENNTYRYEDEKGNTKRVRLEPDFDIMYNYDYPISGFKPDMMKPEMGRVRLIKSGKGGGYTSVMIEEYVNYVVAGVDAQRHIIYTKDKINIDLHGCDYLVYDAEGKNIDLSTVVEWNIASKLTSADGKKVVIYISDEEITGKTTSKGTVKEPIVGIDGTEYYADKKVLNEIKHGELATFYFDYTGNIAGVREESPEGMRYAYLVKALVDEDSGEERAFVRLFDVDGTQKDLYVADKVRINDVLYKEDPHGVVDTGLSLSVNVLKYQLNSKGEINSMYVYDGTTDKYIHEMMNGSYIWTASQRSFGGKVTMASGAPVFAIPEGENYTVEDYRVLGLGSFEDDRTATVKIYTTGDNVYGEIAVRNPAGSGYARPIAVVKKVITSVDADGEIEKRLKVLYEGADYEFALAKVEVLGAVDNGDVIKISLDGNNKIQDLVHIYDHSANKFVQTNPYEPQSGAGYRSSHRCFHGYAYDVTDGLLRFCKDKPEGSKKPETENALLSGFRIYVIDGPEVYVGNENDIKDYTGAGNACSELIVHTMWANPVDIVVIRD